MKKSFASLCLLASSFAMAEVDYSRCLAVSGFIGNPGVEFINSEGKITMPSWLPVKSQSTEGKKEIFTVEFSTYTGGKMETKYTFERDDQGRVIKIITGADQPTPKDIERYKEMLVNNSTMYTPGIMTFEPSFYVDGKMIPLSKLSKEQAKNANIYGVDIEELQKLKSQWKKDKKVAQKLKEGVRKSIEKSALVMPLGQETEFEIKDGVCLVKGVTTKSWNLKDKQVIATPGITRELCEEVQNIKKKYQAKTNECQEHNNKMFSELWDKQKQIYAKGEKFNVFGGGLYGGVAGGFLAGGYAGGGFGGGIFGGYVAGGGLVAGLGGGALGLTYDTANSCEWLYGVAPVSNGSVGAWEMGGKGSKGESKSTQQ